MCLQLAQLRQFLLDQRPRGRAVPGTASRPLQRMEQHLGVPFCTSSLVLDDLSAKKIPTLPQQAQELSLTVWRHFVILDTVPKSEWTKLRLASALVFRHIVSGCRFEHTKKAEYGADLSPGRSMAWKVLKGKDGQPFAVSLPTHVQPHLPLFTDLHSEIVRRFGDTSLFMPGCFCGPGIFPLPASYPRFQQFVRSLMCLFPCLHPHVFSAGVVLTVLQNGPLSFRGVGEGSQPLVSGPAWAPTCAVCCPSVSHKNIQNLPATQTT